MEGKILHFDNTSNKGVVRDNTDQRYQFHLDDWKSDGTPTPGQTVDFVPEDGNATEIYSLSSAEEKSSFSAEDAIRSVKDGFESTTDKIYQGVDSVKNDIKEKGIDETTSVLTSGNHNKFGTAVVFAVLISLFLPAIKVPLLGEFSIFAFMRDSGNYMLIRLIVLAGLFYGGIQRIYTKVLSAIILAVIAYTMLSHSASLDRWGAIVVLGASVMLFMSSFALPYSEKSKQ